MRSRVVAFVVVGAAGFAVQVGSLLWLTRVVRWPDVPAAAIAVEAAIVHNFFWHELWTWRSAAGRRSGALLRLARFHLSNGFTSIVGNVVLTVVGMDLLGVGAVAASALALACTGALNFTLADRWVFTERPSR